MPVPRNPVLRIAFWLYVLVWLASNLIWRDRLAHWGIGWQLLSVLGFSLAINVFDFELSKRENGGVIARPLTFTSNMSLPVTYLLVVLLYTVPVAAGIVNIREGYVEGGIAILAVIHYYFIYFAWVGLRSRT